MNYIDAFNRRTNTEAYQRATDAMKDYGHTNKCVPVAMAIVTGQGYLECMRRLHEVKKVGNRSGYNITHWRPVITAMLNEQGFELEEVPLAEVRKVAKTMKTLTPKALEKLGVVNGFVRSTRHLAAIRGGMVADWSEGKRKKLWTLLRVVPKK